MLAELNMELEVQGEKLGYYQTSNLQGVLMEQIDSEYAEKLHKQGLNPYSQSLITTEKGNIWSVKTLHEEAYQNIIKPLNSEKFTEFVINKKELNVKIRRKELHIKNKKELLQEFYQRRGDRYLNMEFWTPTAFKSNGRYVIIPDKKYIYQSLMNKYSAATEECEMFDMDTLEQLVEYSEITQYRLKSTYFPLEGIKIPAFRGELTLHMLGNDTMARYARLLVRFGEYSGVGIKTAMGMGAVRLKEMGDKK